MFKYFLNDLQKKYDENEIYKYTNNFYINIFIYQFIYSCDIKFF